MKNLTHQLIVGVVCSIFVWISFGWFTPASSYMEDGADTLTLVVDSHTHASVTGTDHHVLDVKVGQDLQEGDTISSFDATGVEIHLPGGAQVRLAPQTTVTIVKLGSDGGNGTAHQVILHTGEAWVNAVGVTTAVNMYSPEGVAVFSNDDVFDVSNRDGSLTVYGAKNSVRTGLFLPDLAHPESFSPEHIALLNSVLVTEGNILNVVLSKIQPKLDKLLYSKLVKEFQYGPVSADDLSNNTWLQLNYGLDRDLRDAKLKHLTDLVKQHNIAVSDPQALSEILRTKSHAVRDLLTFDPARRNQNIIDDLLVDVDDAIYLSTVSQDDNANQRVQLFLSRTQSYSDNPEIMKKLDDALWNRFNRFSLLLPQDGTLFQLRGQLRNALIGLNQGSYTIGFDQASAVTRSYLYDVYAALPSDSSMSQDLLRQYFQAFGRLFITYASEIKKYPGVLAEENQLLAQLYLKSPLFYKDEYLAQKFKLESQWLSLLADGPDKQEEAQTLMASKIDLVKRLRLYFFDEKIALDDARQVLYRLLASLNTSVDASGQDSASAKFVTDTIQEQQSFWLYLNSSEFAESTVHGATNKDRFIAFAKNTQQQAAISSLQSSLFGSAPAPTPETRQTLLDIQQSFAKMSVLKLHISPLLDKDQPQVFIESAEYNGIPFSAIYDRDRSLISDVKVYGETVLSSAIPLVNLNSLFKPKTSSTNGADGLDASVASNSTTVSSPNISTENESIEKVTKGFLLKKLQDIGFQVTMDQIQMSSSQGKLFAVTGASLHFDKNPIVSNFVINLSDFSVSGVSMSVLSQRVSMAGNFTFDTLVDQIKAFYEKAFYDAVAQNTAKSAPVIPVTPSAK